MNTVPTSHFVNMFWGNSMHIADKVGVAAEQLFSRDDIQTAKAGLNSAKSEKAMYPFIDTLVNAVIQIPVDVIDMVPPSNNPVPDSTSSSTHPTQAPPAINSSPVLQYIALGDTVIGGSKSIRKPDGIFVERAVAERYKEQYGKRAARGKTDGKAGEATNWQEGADVPTALKKAAEEAEEAQYVLERLTENVSGTRQVEPNHVTTPSAATTSDAVDQSQSSMPKLASDYLTWPKVAVAMEIKHAKDRGPINSHNSTPAASIEYSSSQLGGSSGVKRKATSHSSDRETKRPRSDENSRPGVIQLKNYLLEMRSALGVRSHTFGCLIVGNSFEIWAADACGYIRSESVDITSPNGFCQFARIIAGLARASTTTLGLDPQFIRPSDLPPAPGDLWPVSIEGWTFVVDAEITVTIRNSLHVQWNLVGRNTAVYRVVWRRGGKEMEGAPKFSYSLATRAREVDLLLTAGLAIGEAGIPALFGSGQGSLVSKSPVRAALSGSVLKPIDRRFEFLLLELLKPIHSLPIQDAVPCYIHVIETLAALDSHGIQHRDVSIANVMVRFDKQTGIPRGVLGDFDLAVQRGDERDNSGSHRTGTFPFLAYNLLDPINGQYPDHILRFDLESLIYVFEWHAIRFTCGKETRFPKGEEPLREWLDHTGMVNFSAKGTGHVVFDRIRREEKVLQSLPAFVQCSTEISDMLFALVFAVMETNRKGSAQLGTPGWDDLAGKFTVNIVTNHFEKIAESFDTVSKQ